MLLADIVHTSRQVAETRSRLQKIDHLGTCLRALGKEAKIGVPYLMGGMRQGRIGMGWATIRKARPNDKPAEARLTLAEVDQTFEQIAQTRGRGSATVRTRILGGLFARATAAEQDFLTRLILGELRQGALEGIMIEAIARAADIPSADIRRAVMLAGDPTPVAITALNEGVDSLARFALRVLQPVKPMLADSADDPADALLRLGEAAFEFKLDGARIQVHKSGDTVRVFSRRLNEVTPATPEVVEAVAPLPCREIILDGEVLALRPDGSPHAFQITMRRFGRRLDVERLRETLPLAPFFFDCLHLDGEDLIDAPGDQRLAAMSAILPPELLVPRKVTADIAEAEAFFHQALEGGHEGVMAKAVTAAYEAGSRGSSWLKIKRFHTLDLVVLAAEWGHGRRRGWLSNLHLGARDPHSGEFVMLGKTFKGMTDKTLAWQTEKLQALAIATDEHIVRVRPELVVEIAFNEIQASQQYPAGMALRFARLKAYRPDKKPGDADTLETVRTIFEGQGEAGS